MSKKLFFIGSLLGLLVLLFLDRPSFFGVCFESERTGLCIAPYNDIAEAYFPLFLVLGICSFIYLFVKGSKNLWVRFSLWYGGISLALIGFFIYQNEYFGGGFSPFSLLTDPVPVSWLLSIIYVAISIVIVTLSASKKR